ncbi:MAG: hypothetical protein ACYDGN_08190 [Acidimicrobiales bacterium]
MTGSADDLGAVQPVADGALSAPPEIIAALAAVVDAVWPRPVVAPRGGPERERGAPEYVWRLSGRWWSKPVPLRRDRPWAAYSGEHGQVGTEGA